MKKRKIWLLTGSVFLVISIIVGIRVGTSPLIKSKFGTVEYCLEKKNHRGSVVDIDGVRFNGRVGYDNHPLAMPAKGDLASAYEFACGTVLYQEWNTTSVLSENEARIWMFVYKDVVVFLLWIMLTLGWTSYREKNTVLDD